MTDRSRSRRFGVRALVLATTAALALTGCTGGPAPTPTASATGRASTGRRCRPPRRRRSRPRAVAAQA